MHVQCDAYRNTQSMVLVSVASAIIQGYSTCGQRTPGSPRRAARSPRRREQAENILNDMLQRRNFLDSCLKTYTVKWKLNMSTSACVQKEDGCHMTALFELRVELLIFTARQSIALQALYATLKPSVRRPSVCLSITLPYCVKTRNAEGCVFTIG